MNKQRILTVVAIVLSTFVLLLMGYTLLYIITNVPQIEDRIRKQVSLDIAGIKVPASVEAVKGDKGDSIIGKDGYTPPCYFKIDMCQGRDGYTPVKNVDYFDGSAGANGFNGNNGLNAYELWLANGNTGTFEDFQEYYRGNSGTDGAPGAPGRTLEQRCTELEPRSRIEQKYTDAEMWEVLYYLAVGQKCEVPNE